MFFYLSKLFYTFVRPMHFMVLLLFLSLAVRLIGWRRLSTGLVTVVSLFFLAMIVLPVSDWIIQPLEARFPRPELVDPAPDGIIVLGGAVDTDAQPGHGSYIGLNDAAERITEIPRLARLYPKARIVYTGGTDREVPGTIAEADAVRQMLIEFGVAPERITIEGRSLTTYENATLTKEIVKPEPGTRWLLVTSAWHMPRSVGVFRKAGWPGIIAFPTDFRVATNSDNWVNLYPGTENLWVFEIAVKEYFGLLGYWLSGRTSELYPGP